jgi:hypothetical protein
VGPHQALQKCRAFLVYIHLYISYLCEKSSLVKLDFQIKVNQSAFDNNGQLLSNYCHLLTTLLTTFTIGGSL